MINQPWKEFSPLKKNPDWMRRILDDIRNRKQFLCTWGRYDLNKSFAEGTYDVSWIKKQFDTFNTNPNELNLILDPLNIFGNRLTSIVSMIEKLGFEAKATTTDPTARSKRDEDIELLKAEKELEPLRRQMGQALGLGKPLPIAGEEDYSSDMSPINKMGLDIQNPLDEAFFKDSLQRQVWEIALEVGVTNYLNQNEYNEVFKLILADLINNNCCAQQVVTNSYSGQPQLSYLYPFNVYTILSKRNDGKDAIAKGWEKNVTVREIIAIMGQDITADNLDELLSLATSNGYNGTTNYEGIWFATNRSDPTQGFSYPSLGLPSDRCCTWEAFVNFTCTLGYVEVKAQNSDLYIHRKEDGNLLTEIKDYDYEVPKNVRQVDSENELKKDSDRYLEYKFYDTTYKGFYLPFSNMVFGFGKLPLAVRYGTNNELTDFSIATQRLKGKSMNENCQPFIKHIMSMWAKLQHWINESRASGESFDIDVIRELSQEIIGTSANESKILETLKVLQNTTNTVHKTVKTVEGQVIGGDGDPVKQRIRGLDPTIMDLWALIQRDKDEIISITGVSDVLLATQSTQAGLGVSQLVLQQSLNTIFYIQSAAQKLFSDTCLNFAQKIQYIATGDKSVEAYKSLVLAIGQRNVDAIALLGDTPTWAYSIFIEFGMNSLQRNEVDQLTNALVQSKSITAAQAFSVKDIKNWKLAGALLHFYEQKALQQQQAAAQVQIQGGLAAEDQKHKNKMEELTVEGQWRDKVANTTGEWNYRVEELQISGKSSIEDKRQASKVVHSVQAHENEIERLQTEKQLEKENNQNGKPKQ